MASTIDPKTGLPITNQAIPTSALSTPQTPLTITPPADTTPILNSALNTGASTVQQGLDAVTLEQKAAQEQQKRVEGAGTVADLTRMAGGRLQERANLAQTNGENELLKQISGYNTQAQGLIREATAIPLQTGAAYQGSSGTQAGVASVNRDLLQRNALQSLTLAQSAAIAQGNYDVAKNLADQQVNAKYAQIDAEIAARKINEEALYKNVTDPAIKKALEARMALTKKEEQMQVEKRETEKSISDIGMTLRKYGASDSVVKDVLSSTNIDDAIIKAGSNLRDPKALLELQSLKADIALKQAQTAKTNREAQLSKEPTITEKKAAVQAISNAKASVQAANDKITAVDAALGYKNGIASRVGTNMFGRGIVAPALGGAVAGAGLGPLGAVAGAGLAARSGITSSLTGEGQQLSGAVHQLTSGLTLQTLIDAKANGATFGALSDGERSMIASAATKLNDWEIKDDKGNPTGYWNIDEASFKKELQTIQDLSRRALQKSQGTLMTPDEQKILDASFGVPVVSANQYFQ